MTEETAPIPQRKKSDDTIIYTKDTPTCLDEKDAIHRAVEGLKFAASNVKELHARQPKLGWDDVKKSLDEMIKNVRKMATDKAPGRQVVGQVIDLMSKSLSNG